MNYQPVILKRSLCCIFLFKILASTSVLAEAPMVMTDQLVRVTENVFVIPDKRKSLVPNIGIIIGEQSVMVVDTGMGPANAEIVLEEVKKITDKPISYLAITHFHPEHGMGAQSFPDDTRIVVPMAQKTELKEKGKDYIGFFSEMSPEIADLLANVELVEPDIAFTSKLEVDLGNLEVQLLHFVRDHTRGDMFVFIPSQRLLFGGDIILDRFFPIMADADSSPSGWIKTLKSLKSLKPQLIVPGHGDISDVSLIDQLSIYLTAMQVQVTAQKKNGASLEQARAALIPQFARSYSHWDNPQWINQTIERFYVELD